jgi:hypothetical protein
MKITSHWVDEENNLLKINIESETHTESNELIEYAKRCKLPVKTYGKVEKNRTWVWFQIPVRNLGYKDLYFGNDKDVVK